MVWMTGRLMQATDSQRLCMRTMSGLHEFHCGDPLMVRHHGAWERGRVEFGDRRGWYWTNDRIDLPLGPGREARIWDGLLWPVRESDRPGRDR